MSADDRRATLIEATLPLLVEHGRTVTTKQIADAAGVAEGTIFRVFESKDDLIRDALDQAFDTEPLLRDVRAIDPDQSLRELVTAFAEILQARFQGIFALMSAVGIVGPPTARRHSHDAREEATRSVIELLAPHAEELTVPVEHLVRVVRLLTFSGSHPHLTDGHPLSATDIVTAVLDGLVRKAD